ncbi:hypothetical protein [Sutcliffiella horikoshii]|uniref:hypothetical protein n=1 Tax=Sutcliffiella horikoshii TaxID=79883 RepID=UPI003CEF32E0
MKKKLGFCILSLSIFLFGGFTGFNNVIGGHSKTTVVSAEWIEPNSVEELISKSDLIVVGKVKDPKATIQPFEEQEQLLYSLYDLDIKVTLKGDTSLKNIPLINYGGVNENGEKIVWEEITQPSKNNLYLMFLDKITDENVKDERFGKYRPLNGPAGTFSITAKDKNLLKKLVNAGTLEVNDILNEELELTIEHVNLNIQKDIINKGLKKIATLSKEDK